MIVTIQTAASLTLLTLILSNNSVYRSSINFLFKWVVNLNKDWQ